MLIYPLQKVIFVAIKRFGEDYK